MRHVHPDGYVGLEVDDGGRSAPVILGWGNARIPILTASERRWLAEELRKVDDDAAIKRPVRGYRRDEELD